MPLDPTSNPFSQYSQWNDDNYQENNAATYSNQQQGSEDPWQTASRPWEEYKPSTAQPVKKPSSNYQWEDDYQSGKSTFASSQPWAPDSSTYSSQSDNPSQVYSPNYSSIESTPGLHGPALAATIFFSIVVGIAMVFLSAYGYITYKRRQRRRDAGIINMVSMDDLMPAAESQPLASAPESEDEERKPRKSNTFTIAQSVKLGTSSHKIVRATTAPRME